MLEGDSDSSRSKNSEEDDIGCYFLQPSSSPYNITEKVQQANFDLFSSTMSNEKTAKVKFKDELVSFEPELTDDDVNSIESDNMEPTLPPLNNLINGFSDTLLLEPAIIRNNFKNSEMFKLEGMVLEEIEELNHDDDYDIEDDEEEIIEESVFVDNNCDRDVTLSQQENTPKEIKTAEDATPNIIESKTDPNLFKIINKKQIINTAESNPNTKSSKKSSKSNKKSPTTKTLTKCSEIHCKDHCIEKLDHSLSMSIKKLEIHEKPLNLPPLQLHQRKCCDENSKLSSTSSQLPHYNGYRSEYGLSCRQLERRRKQLEMLRQKEITRQNLIEEFKNRRIQQNEKVFCQWLKEISKRRISNKNCFSLPLHYSSGSVGNTKRNTPSSYGSNVNKESRFQLKDRPKTANDFIPKSSVKKKQRPHTTHSCVFIEVPQNILEKGIQIGDLLISNSKMFTKKLHILAVS